MSRSATTLARMIFSDNFKGITGSVGDYLLENGEQSLLMICRGCKLPVSKVQEVLRILIQHHFVTLLPSSDLTMYRLNHEAVLNLLRYPGYIRFVGKKLGMDAQVLVQRILKLGELPISKLLFISGCEILEAKPDIPDEDLYQKLNSLYVSVKLLAEFRFIIKRRLDDVGKDDEPLSSRTAVEDDRENPNSISRPELFDIPKVDLNDLVKEVKLQEKGNVEKFPDAEIYFKLNIRKFQESTRNKLVLAALERKYKPMVDSKIIEVIIDLGFVKYPWEKESVPVSVNEVADILRKALGDTHLNKYINEYFDILEQDSLRIFTKLGSSFGGQFIFNMQKAITHITWNTIEKIVADRHGYHAARIFRLIKENDYVEQERLQELAMIPAKDAKQLTYKLVNDRLVFIKEVRKTYSVGGVPGKVAFVFHVDLNQAVLALMESSYKAMLNCKIKERKECSKHAQLLQKEDRINRILAKMKGQQCTEEQMAEIKELITPPQRAVLNVHETRTKTLMSGIIHVDETIFILQLFLLYNQKKAPSKSGRSR